MSYYPPQVTPPSMADGGTQTPAGGGRVIAWVVILASIATLVALNAREARLRAREAEAGASMQIEISCRYVVGAAELLRRVGRANSSAQMLAGIEKAATTPHDQLALVPVVGELRGESAALNRLKSLNVSKNSAEASDAQALRAIYEHGPDALSDSQRRALIAHAGWCGRLALVFGKPASDPGRSAVLADAGRTVLAMAGGLILGGAALLAGVVLLIVTIVLASDRGLACAYRPAPAGSGPFLEAFAIYLAGFIGVYFLAQALFSTWKGNLATRIALMVAPTALAIIWPLLRGTSIQGWRMALGWHAGRGTLREIGSGIVGYLTGLPLLAGAMLVTLRLIHASGAHPSHPIQRLLGGSDASVLTAFILASIWAPITEETLFRGAFFHALRARHRWLFSALASGFVFAVIHPQGWTVLPVLMTMGVVLAGIREWRGTILASATAHCLHNSALLAFAVLTMR